MAQHFLLSPEAKTLSLIKVLRTTDKAAENAFRSIRWAETDGEPICPECGCPEYYNLKSRPVWKCKGCKKTVLDHVRHDLSWPQVGPSRHPRSHRDIHKRRERHFSASNEPRPWRFLQLRFRSLPQDARSHSAGSRRGCSER